MATRTMGDAQSPSSRDWIKEISNKAEPKPTAAVIYGPPGVGKTEFAAHFADPIFLIDDQEDGINPLKAAGFVPADIPVLPAATSWGDVLDMLSFVASSPGIKNKTLVVDTIGGMERLDHKKVTEVDYKGKPALFTAYFQGEKAALPEWHEFLKLLDRIRIDKKMSIVLLAHSKVAIQKPSDSADYGMTVPDVSQPTWGATHKWADMILYCEYDVDVEKDKGDSRAKASGGKTRTMNTEHDAAFEAKNRFRLPPEISMGNSGKEAYNNLKTAIAEAKKG